MNSEKQRLNECRVNKKNWKKWGSYISERQWGTVREDYSSNGDAWSYTTYDSARSKTYRWGEEGIAGICDQNQLLCISFAFWNKKDPIIKEVLYGLSSDEGNHGEDVKEYYYYLDNTPTHSYMKMLYKYPQNKFPYNLLIEENSRRGKYDPEYELIDTGIFDDDEYFDIFIEYAKADVEDILIRITIYNRGSKDARLNMLPEIWFRNTWAWGYNNYKPKLTSTTNRSIEVDHKNLKNLALHFEEKPEIVFCENETNSKRLYGVKSASRYFKDGINDYIIDGNKSKINPDLSGTKAALNYNLEIPAGGSKILRLRMGPKSLKLPFTHFNKIFKLRINEAYEFYKEYNLKIDDKDLKSIQRQAFAGMLWNKQFYYYDIPKWLNGDPALPPPPKERLTGRNSDWFHLNNADIISMPDKWEYPWYAAWDLAFHCIPLATIDPDFAKQQLLLLTHEWYMHPNGQFPAYEWNFSDVNPPVHAWAAWRVFKIDEKYSGKKDIKFLEAVFHKLLINFTWWVNKKDADEHNIFQGGFLGLDNIGLFDRSNELVTGGHIEQADGTSWMAMYSLNLMRISLELALDNPVYQDMATKFFEHFLYIAGAMTNMGGGGISLWDDEDEFFYDMIHSSDNKHLKLKVRSIVGLIPLFAVEVLEPELMNELKEFSVRLEWFLNYRPDLAKLVSRWHEPGLGDRRLLSLLRGHRIKMLLKRMLDETEFLSDYGIRALSKYYEKQPYEFKFHNKSFSVNYEPAESQTGMFGGNSNWRGPIWFPVNFLIIESLQKFYHYYGDDFKVEYPTNSGKFLTIKEISNELTKRLIKLFVRDEKGFRPSQGKNKKIQFDPHFRDYIFFYEYFNGDTGEGLGASHQTGWTGLIAKLIHPRD